MQYFRDQIRAQPIGKYFDAAEGAPSHAQLTFPQTLQKQANFRHAATFLLDFKFTGRREILLETTSVEGYNQLLLF